MKHNSSYTMTAIGTRDISTVIAEPVGHGSSHPIIINQIVERKESSTTASLILIAGIVFWAHGSASHDAWFKGEELAGEIITGIVIAYVGLMCCCGCCIGASLAAANSKDSEVDVSLNETARANNFLKNNAPRQLLNDIFKHNDSQKAVVDVESPSFELN